MRILVLSDIHANWPALCAVFAQEEYDECLVIGDLVDYATGARDVIAWVRENACGVIRGNHDHAVAQFIMPSKPESGFKLLRNETRNYHWDSLSQRDLNYLAQLPLSLEVELDGLKFYLIHASPRDPLNEYLPNVPQVWEERLKEIDADIVCVGHTHFPYICNLGDQRVLNPGSVGQPRDSDPRASYAIIENGDIQLKRIEYDIDKTITQMRQSGLSEEAIQAAQRILHSGSTEIPGGKKA